MTAQAPTGKIITFYSYKGGTGRSMALANIAWILASARKRVLVLDWDLEAPGLHRYFRPFLIDKELTSSPGIIDYIIDFCDEAIKPLAKGETLPPDWYVAHADISRYRISIDYAYFPDGGKIDFVPAGQQGTTYATRVNAFNWQEFYQRLGGGAFLAATRERMREKYDYILIDSRTGVSDTAGICTVQMPDVLIVFFTFNNQSIEGAAAVAQSVYDQRGKERQRGTHKFQILAVPTRVDQTELKKLRQRKVYAHWRFNPFLEQISAGERKSYWGTVEVPYVPYFAYEEVLAPFNDDIDDPKTVLASMKRITDFLVRPEMPVLEVATLISPQNQQRILEEFAATPAPITEDGQPSPPSIGEEPSAAPTESILQKQLRLAEASYISLNETDREEARRLWTRLVRIPRLGEKAENSKVRVSLSEIRGEAYALLDKLVDLDLLTYGKDEKSGEETIEVSNEELLRSWPRLRDWLAKEPYLFPWRQELQGNKAQWEDDNRKSKKLPEKLRFWSTKLISGEELFEARRWYKSHREYLSDNEAAFIETSWRRFLRVAAAAIFILLLVPLTAYFYSKRSNKEDLAEKLANEAQLNIDASSTGNEQGDQFQLGILLATEALRISHSSKAEAILRQNLPKLPRRVSVSLPYNNVLEVALNSRGSGVLAVTGRPRGSQFQPEDRAAQYQDIETGRIVSRMPFKQGSSIFDLSRDGAHFAIADDSGAVTVWDENGNEFAHTKHTGTVRDLAFSPSSDYFASAGADKTVQIIDLTYRRGRSTFAFGSGAPINAVTFSANGVYVAVADDSSFVYVKQISPEEDSTNPLPPTNIIKLDSSAFTIALSPEGDYLAAIPFQNRRVGVWQVSNGRSIKLDHDYNVSSITFSPDGKFIITAGGGGNITIWDLEGRIINKLRYEGDVDKVVLDGTTIGVVGNSKVARLWNYNDGRFESPVVLIHDSTVNDLAFGAGFVVTASADGRIRVWRLGVPLAKDLEYEPCGRLTRNLTIEEWNKYLAADLGAYRRTCADIP
jgi:WD40 repeat protein/cellulose biosynthesis protein BcsQ